MLSCLPSPLVLQSLLLAAAPPPAGGLAKFVPAQAKGRSADKVSVVDPVGKMQGVAWTAAPWLVCSLRMFVVLHSCTRLLCCMFPAIGQALPPVVAMFDRAPFFCGLVCRMRRRARTKRSSSCALPGSTAGTSRPASLAVPPRLAAAAWAWAAAAAVAAAAEPPAAGRRRRQAAQAGAAQQAQRHPGDLWGCETGATSLICSSQLGKRACSSAERSWWTAAAQRAAAVAVMAAPAATAMGGCLAQQPTLCSRCRDHRQLRHSSRQQEHQQQDPGQQQLLQQWPPEHRLPPPSPREGLSTWGALRCSPWAAWGGSWGHVQRLPTAAACNPTAALATAAAAAKAPLCPLEQRCCGRCCSSRR